uniref:Root phototropism protein 3-like isoform X2 n=1 Tax=Rhizophora mucronata TaxID=61149 RepID=A0A2P2J130_RHIMU
MIVCLDSNLPSALELENAQRASAQDLYHTMSHFYCKKELEGLPMLPARIAFPRVSPIQ